MTSWNTHHSLLGRGSRVTTGFVHGNHWFSTPHKFDLPWLIVKKIVTGDYVSNSYRETKFGANPRTGGFWANAWNITNLFIFIPSFWKLTYRSDWSANFHAWWLKQCGLAQWCAFWGFRLYCSLFNGWNSSKTPMAAAILKNRKIVYVTHLILSHLTSFHLNWTEQHWAADRCSPVQFSSDEMRSDAMRWDEWMWTLLGKNHRGEVKRAAVYSRTLGVTLTSAAEDDQDDGQDEHDTATDTRYYDDRLQGQRLIVRLHHDSLAQHSHRSQNIY